jgi:hypothetical protein
MASELIKSVRIRPIKEPSGYKSGAFEGGSLDYNVSIFRSGRRERWCAAFKLRSNGENSTAAWFQLTYSGRRYEDKTDDEIISEFIKTNTVRENRTLKDGLIDITENGETKSVPFYQIIQDPFDKIPPPSRRYGSDPYHLNNGAQVFIRWFSGKPESVYYTYNNLTTASQSTIGEVTVQIVTNEPGKEPLVFTYSSANNPSQPGMTPSYNDMETYLEYTYGSISSESSFVGYKRPPEKFIDTDNLQLVSGVQYGRKSDNQNTTQGFGQIDGFIDDARDSITQSISIKPEGLIKKVEVVPPDGQPIWGLPSEIGDYGFDFSSTLPIYLTDLSSSTSSGTQSESTNKVSEKYFYDYSYEGNFNQGQDWMIIDELLKAWNKKFPGYNVALNEPSYLYVSDFVKKEYKDPVKTLDEVVAEEDLQDPAPNITATESNLIKLNILFPTEFEVEARKDCPDFRIFVGDIPTELLPGEGFQFQDDFNELEELDPEYIEAAFAGGEELQNEAELEEIEDQIRNTNTNNEQADIPSTGGSAGIAAKTPGFEGSIGNEFNGVPYFAQWDSRWAKKAYGAKCEGSPTIKSSGCGPTSVTMAICYWASKGYCNAAIPPEIAEIFERTGGRVCGVGTGLGPAKLAKELKDKYGLVLKAVKESQIRGILQKKYPCIISGKAYGSKGNAYAVSGKKTQNTTAGHFVCLTGIDGQGRIRVNDPGYAAKSGVAAFDANTNPSSNMKSINQIYTLYPEKLGSPV